MCTVLYYCHRVSTQSQLTKYIFNLLLLLDHYKGNVRQEHIIKQNIENQHLPLVFLCLSNIKPRACNTVQPSRAKI